LSREKERAAIDRAIGDPLKRKYPYLMVDAVWMVRDTGMVTEAELAPIRAAFLERDPDIWRRAGGWLAKLVEFSNEVTGVVDELASHPDEAVRYRLCASLMDPRFPDVLIRQRLRKLLTDPSQMVREMTVTVCLKRPNQKLIPALEAARDVETLPELRQRLAMAITLIKGEPYYLA